MAAGIDNLEENWSKEGEGRRCEEGEQLPMRRKAKRRRRKGRQNVTGEKEDEVSLRKVKRHRCYGRRSVTGGMEGEASPVLWKAKVPGARKVKGR